MVIADFFEDNFKLYNENDCYLFNDNDHEFFLNYLRVDFSQIETLLEKFFYEQFDFDLLQFKKNRPEIIYNDEYKEALKSNNILYLPDYEIPNVYIIEIIEFLEKSHDYFTIDSNALKVTEDILVDYFNFRLCFNEVVLDKHEYVKKIKTLFEIPPLFPLNDDGTIPRDTRDLNFSNYFNDYFKLYDEYINFRRMIKKGKKFELPSPKIKIVEEQRRMNKLLLDLCSNSTENKQKNEKFIFDLKMNVSFIIENNVIREKFKIENINQLLNYELIQIIKNMKIIKKCQCCNNFFITVDNRINYCDRKFNGNKTCKDIGPDIYFRNKKKDDTMYQSYLTALSKNQMRLNRGFITSEEFLYWKEKINEKRTCKSEDFNFWLQLSINEIKDIYERNGKQK